MKPIIFISILFLAACSSSGITARSAGSTLEPIMCEFDFYDISECNVTVDKQQVAISLRTSTMPEHELQLTHIVIDKSNVTITLPLSHTVSIMPGDQGYILVEDINFDQRPDIAVSTSFGVANPYMDYWVASENTEQFHHVGNFPRLKVDSDTHTLSATVRVNAATYENKKWRWENQELVRVRTH